MKEPYENVKSGNGKLGLPAWGAWARGVHGAHEVHMQAPNVYEACERRLLQQLMHTL